MTHCRRHPRYATHTGEYGLKAAKGSTYTIAHLALHMNQMIMENPDVSPVGTNLYVQTSTGPVPVAGIFLARINGERVLVIDGEESHDDDAAVSA